jgi:radical SAM-linked protein
VSPRKQPEQQLPPVQRLRLRYAKRGRARFASHRDFGRAFERALRRAEIPMAFSSGFHPHPRISYANAAATGAASEAEYLEIGLAEQRDPAWVRDALNAAMPEGLVIVAVAESAGGSLADRLGASRWQVNLPGVDAEVLAAAVRELLAAETATVERKTKSGLRSFDIRPAVLGLTVSAAGFELVSAIGEPLVRPDDVLTALQGLRAELNTGTPALFGRIEQGPWDGQRINDPLAADQS